MRCAHLLMLLAFGCDLIAGTRETVRTIIEGHENLSVRYQLGSKSRFEVLKPDGSIDSISISDFDRKANYWLDPTLHEYTDNSIPPPSFLWTLAHWISRPPTQSGKRVEIYYETIDTKERRQFSGQTASHLRLVQRRVAEPGACNSTNYTIESDGWYIPAENGPHAIASLSVFNPRCEDIVIRHGSPAVSGVCVLETGNNFQREVIQLSHEPLDDSLFEIPPGYKNVEVLTRLHSKGVSESVQFASDWHHLESAIQSWFR